MIETEKPPSSRRRIITVDGLAASGKSTLAEKLAEKLGFAHLNSGLLYRALAWIAIRDCIDLDDAEGLLKILQTHRFQYGTRSVAGYGIYIDGKDITDEIQTSEISSASSISSRHARLREALVPLQREAFSPGDIVAEGRDMGTVVFPDAPLKFFVVAPEDIRVKRRLKQISSSRRGDQESDKVLKERLEKEISERDKRDSERKNSPTRAASDAIVINNVDSLTSVLGTMYDAVIKSGILGR